MKVISILILLLTCFFLSAQEVDTLEPENSDYESELLNFYFENEEYNLVISIVDTLEYSDELMFLKGMSHHLSGDSKTAIDVLSDIILVGTDDIKKLEASKKIKNIAKEFAPQESIEILSELLEKFEFSEFYPQILLLIAEVYEDFQLYEEANDVYTMLLEEDDKYKVKIGINYILQKRFGKALEILLPITETESDNQDEVLYLTYLAYFSMQKTESAKAVLIRLYNEFPDCDKRIEILSNLADIFAAEKKLVTSWFLLEEASKLSSEIQLYHLNNKINNIRILIASDSLNIYQFEHLKLDLNSTTEITE